MSYQVKTDHSEEPPNPLDSDLSRSLQERRQMGGEGGRKQKAVNYEGSGGRVQGSGTALKAVIPAQAGIQVQSAQHGFPLTRE
jgi:hypothetical protein